MDEIKAKQQVVEKIKESSKILVTVSDSPSVDALSAALGLALVLEKQEKYATAIFSGETPPAIAFLEPEKTFDDTTDSLRDFIIALNKEKADHLRYKIEGDAVKIFITPYKTVIDQSDLEFSQGDYNVELVIALGVDNQESLDTALDNHGQILHDAAIITITAGEQTSDLGGVDWHDGGASSLSEMVAGLAEALKPDKKKSLIDETIATALLTGIVAETDRFSNEHTTSKVMTVAANLMSAGADQQLIANELRAAKEIEQSPVEPAEETPAETTDETPEEANNEAIEAKKNHDPSMLAISHEGESLADLDRRVRGDKKAKEMVVEEVAAAQDKAAQQDEGETAPVISAARTENPDELVPAPENNAYGVSVASDEVTPTLGGTLNATTEQAAEDARREAESDKNRTILSHAYLSPEPSDEAAGQAEGPAGFPGAPAVAPGSVSVNDMPEATEATTLEGSVAPQSAYALPDEPAPTAAPESAPEAVEPAPASAPQVEQPAISGERIIQPLSATEPPVVAAETPLPVAPETAPNPTPADLGLPLPPPLPDFSQINGAAPALPLEPSPQPEILGDILAPEPETVDVTANTIAAPNSAYAFEPEPVTPEGAPVEPQPAPAPVAQGAAPADPGQFQIPPQG